MLPLGRLRVTAKEGGGTPTKFTPDEQQTVMTLWSIFRSPLVFGGDLTANDRATTALLTNEEVLAVDQQSKNGRESLEEGNLRVWIADAPSRDRYVAVFNLGESTQTAKFPWTKIGIQANHAMVRDLWTKESLGRKPGLEVELRPHTSVLYRLSDLQ
jgi:alpha-galactosidase